MNIVVTGSLGHIGKPLTQQLVNEGHAVTVISTKPDRRKDIEALGATTAIGSLEDVGFLTSIFAGADAVFAMVPPNFAELDQVAYYQRIAKNYGQAIETSPIKRVVHLSSYGAHLEKGTGFILGAHFAEEILNELSHVTITHLRAGYFYYNLYNFVDVIKGAGFISENYGGDDKMVLVDPKDIAAAAAEELTTTNRNKVQYVVSDEHTANEVAQILGAAIGKPEMKWITLTNEEMKEGMETAGVPSHVIANFVEMGASLHSGALIEDYEAHKPIIMGSVKLQDFANEFAAAYK